MEVNLDSIEVHLPISSRASCMLPRAKPVGTTDLVMVFPRRTGGERLNPEKFTQKRFVQTMLGLSDHASTDNLTAILRSAKCFVSNDGCPFAPAAYEALPTTDWIKSSQTSPPTETFQMRYDELTRRMDCLRYEYVESLGSAADTTEEAYCELMARAIAKRIQLVCGLTTYMFTTKRRNLADDEHLRVEAERIEYRLQTSNKPLDPVHSHKLRRIGLRDPSAISEARAHLISQARNDDDFTSAEAEMDPWLISRGGDYQSALHRALKRWGHNEAADGTFPPPPVLEHPKPTIMARFWREMLNIPHDPYTYFAVSTPFKSEPKFQPLYRMYPASADRFSEDTLFRQVDRIRLCSSILNQHVNVGVLKHSGHCLDLFPLHNRVVLDHLRRTWALRLTLTSQPLGLIRDYFGEKIALYFAWLEFYTKCLTAPAVVGASIYVLESYGLCDVRAAKIIFASSISIWSTFFTKFWHRKTRLYTVAWGVDVADLVAQPRVQYIGKKRMNPIDNMPQIWNVATSSFHRRQYLSYVIVVILLLIVLVALCGLFFLKHLAADSSNATWALTGVNILNSVQITILNKVYHIVAVWLNDWENHRTDVGYENHLITKVFSFQFCNSFASFFYTAFIKAAVGDPCESNSCIGELRVQILTLFLVAIVGGNFVEVALPLVRYRFNLWRAQEHASDLSEEERQVMWTSYDDDDAFADYNEIVIQYGFVTLFVIAMPLTPLLAIANNVLEVHIDAFKLCNGHRRPFPHRASDIGSWYYFLTLMNYLAVVTNIGIVLFTPDPQDRYTTETTTLVKWVTFVIAEHASLIIKTMVAAAVPDEPKMLKSLRLRHKNIEATVFLGQVPADDHHADLSQQAEKLNLYIHESSAPKAQMP
ncbi:anoctamin-like protein [Achlya hypogyna]|uniref:Anoctamin-like protein n=1 Tax=Achlya hypogyna TaxID=1202772 RepID=A0A1V9YYJ1_ACHHY|nr:anoctamin-like protein [Achlya hypogyna]